MPIDLLPFSAFALESSGAPAQATGESHTLTLRLTRLPIHQSYLAAMSGTVRVQDAIAPDSECLLRAAVVHGDRSALTITFLAGD